MLLPSSPSSSSLMHRAWTARVTSERLTCPVLFLELGSLHLRRLRVELLQVAMVVPFVPGH